MKEQYLNREVAVLRSRLEEGRTRYEIELEEIVEGLRTQLLEAESHGKSL